jgi:Ras GTPase-activating-like protein IQGAP2/3
MGMHGLDRVSERSDSSNGDMEQHSDRVGLGLPDGAKSSRGRRMASDAGEDEMGAIVIPGITVGSDSVAGMTGRLRLARQPTRTKYGNLPSQTMKAMDNQRQNLQAYEYLCHVSEAKEWLVQCLSAHPMTPTMVSASPDLTSPTFSPRPNEEEDEDPSGLSNKSVVELEEALRNGVALARLARAFMGAKAVPRIFTVSYASIATDKNMTEQPASTGSATSVPAFGQYQLFLPVHARCWTS